MSEKNLKIIDRNLFAEFKNLKFLYLAHNQLQNIDGSLFEGLENLTVINLAYNQIKHIEKNAFRFLSNIEEINLKRNQLKEIDKFVFKSIYTFFYVAVLLYLLIIFLNRFKQTQKNLFEWKPIRRIKARSLFGEEC